MLWSTNEFLLLFAAFAAFLVTIELCFRLGLRHYQKNDNSAMTHIGGLQAALLGLLALLLGFTFSMAVSRFNACKSLVVEEANAIGTAYLRARLLPAPQQKEVSELLKVYLSQRLACADTWADQTLLEETYTSASRTQAQLWKSAVEVSMQDPRSIPIGLFVLALNDMIDVSEKRRVALENHVPEVVIYLLFFNSVVALGFIAYSGGLSGKRRVGSTAIFALLIAIVLTAILDIDRPRRGLIQVSQESMLRLKADMEKSTP